MTALGLFQNACVHIASKSAAEGEGDIEVDSHMLA